MSYQLTTVDPATLPLASYTGQHGTIRPGDRVTVDQPRLSFLYGLDDIYIVTELTKPHPGRPVQATLNDFQHQISAAHLRLAAGTPGHPQP